MSDEHGTITDRELHALIDGELSAEQEVRLRDRLAHDPEATARLADYRAINERLREAYAPLIDAPVPARLLVAGARRSRVVGRMALALAAGIVLGLGIGLWLGSAAPGADTAVIERALSAHRVFIPEVRHAVEVTAAERAHLDRWLTKRMQHELAAPDLTSEGLSLVGGRLLPDRGRPAAQYMYETASGERVTIYCQLEDTGRETALHFAVDGDDHLFHWLEGGMAYAIVAANALPREQLRAAAEIAHREM